MRSWKAEGLIDTQGFLFKKSFKLRNCTVFQKKDRMCINVELQESDEVQLGDIEKLASKEAKKTCSILSLVTGRRFAFKDFGRIIETTPSAQRKTVSQKFQLLGRVVGPELKPPLQKEAIHILKLMENADQHILKTIDYFEKGLTLSEWNEDAFLNFFKAIELISKKYHKQADPNEIHRIFHKSKKKLTTKDRMLYTCQKLNIPSHWSSKVNVLVDKRNKQDVAHAKLSTGQISATDVYNCEAIAKLVIVNYLKKLVRTP